MAHHPKAKGEKTQAIVLAELVRRDYLVLTPYGDNARYDFVIDAGTFMKRLQCKTGRLKKNGAVHFNPKRTQSNSKGCTYKFYTLQEIDGFIVYCAETNKVYVVPLRKEVKGGGILRIEPPRNGKTQGVQWAKDFEIDNTSIVRWLNK